MLLTRMAPELLYLYALVIGGKKMKKGTLFIVLLCAMLVNAKAQKDSIRLDSTVVDTDSAEYELVVLDPGFDSFLFTQPTMDYYSQEYYEHWNFRYVMEWNARHSQLLEYGDMYETYIDYRPDIDYGLELNYKLFYYFRYFENKHRVKLLVERVF
ncbi:DUF6146 family protein [Bacteroidota bacterium]